MVSKDEDWKQKYKELTLEIEQKAQRGLQVEQTLRQLVNHLLVLVQGEGGELDQVIIGIRPLLDDPSVSAEDLSYRSQQLSKILSRHEAGRSQHARMAVAAMQKWLKLLLSTGPVEGKRKRLEQLVHDTLQVEDSIYRLAPMLSELVEYQLRDARTLVADSQHPEKAQEPIQLLQHIRDELRQLVMGILVPDARKASADAILQKLDSGIDLPDLPILVNQLASLILNINGSGHKDFEHYLLELSQRLAEVQTSVLGNREVMLSGTESHDVLDREVRQNVSELSAVMDSTRDLHQLKQAVSRQLSNLQQAMSSFRQREQAREQQVQHRHDELVEKIAQLETEAGKVREHMEAERLRARTDSLTGLPNRAAYEDYLQQELQRWERYAIPFSLVIADLDNFKLINDNFGHLAGDKVLKLVGKLIRSKLRATDFAARIGGEEFVLILPSSEREGSQRAAEKLRILLEQSPFNFGGQPVGVSMSFGISEIHKGDSAEDVFARADAALYQAKSDGRNCIRWK